MTGTRGEIVDATIALDALLAEPGFEFCTRFDIDPRELMIHSTGRATDVLQRINLGANPLDALTALFTHGTLLGLQIAEHRSETVDKLIEDAA